MDHLEKIGGKMALNHGLTYGLTFLILFTLILIYFSDGLLGYLGIYTALTYNHLFTSFTLLYIFFAFTLRYLGKRNVKSILKKKSVLKTSAEFSFGVNITIGSVFLVSQSMLGGFKGYKYLNISILNLIIFLGTITTFTLGLYIVKLTQEGIKDSGIV